MIVRPARQRLKKQNKTTATGCVHNASRVDDPSDIRDPFRSVSRSRFANMSLVFKKRDGRRPLDEQTVVQARQSLHLLPCKIHPRSPDSDKQTFSAPVDRYFRPYTDATADEENGALWHASLRGKPLTGVELNMPDGYVGILCSSKVEPDNFEATVKVTADDEVTRQLMYWNWDRVPTREDPLLAAFDWVRVSEAMA
ncbi:uncharacterized protein LOC112692238 [Sipha flava]|uniref:Uncharacterized protein LOC112692238 n=1 Tax=Sipha flava TaxID=143950 RepID=A0A2S2Q7U8_9HEMI|nr:uncharacterized protein LOC112692238 [Sipha flava]